MFSPWTRDARVQADVVSIAPDVAGFVDEVRVKDNQFVHKGDILVVLDRERYSRALATAAANVAALKAQMTDADGTCRIKKVAMEASHSNNLVQLADMICGAVNRSFTSGDDAYRTIIKRHEKFVQRWPQGLG